MAFQISPGIEINEIDQTNVVPAVATTVGAYAGHFNWGPVDEIVTVGSEKELADNFGAPTKSGSARSFLTAASYLKYSNSLRVSRAIGAGALNAADSNPVLIKNKDQFDSLTGLDFIFSARFPGALGNSIKVSMAYVTGEGDGAYDAWTYKDLFASAPNRSITAQAAGIATNDEIHLVVIDELGLITGTKGTILERYEGLSLGSNAKTEDGTSLFYKDVINNTSSYIYVNTLDSIFPEADTEITPDSVFAVEGTSVNDIASLVLPFNQIVTTTVQYGAGEESVTITSTPQPVTVKSNFEGEIGNFAKINVRHLAIGDAPAVAARGYINYGVPVNDDTVIVEGNTFTKVAATPGVTEFTSISELAALIGAVTDLSATVYGNYIVIEAETAGAAGNAYTLAVGETNAGTLAVSGETLEGGKEEDADNYLTVSIDDLAPADGFVTWDVTVAVDTLVVGPVTTNTTAVSLADIIKEIELEYIILGNGDVPELTYFVGGEAVTAVDTEASAVLDIEELLPYAVSQEVLKVIPFSGGDTVSFNDETLVSTFTLTSGADGSVVPGNVVTALEHFVDPDTISIDFLFGESFDSGQDVVDSKLYEVANSRKDIIAAISAPLSVATLSSNTLKKQAVINKFDAGTYSSTSFVVFDQTPVYTYNKYADTYVWIPAAGHVAGLCANSDLVADPWFSPAGYNRGQLKGVIKIAYNPTRTDRDDLYNKRINSIISVPGQGVILLGDRTALSKPSAFDRINVRRLFNVLERAIATAAKFQLFELNDEFTRVAFKNTIEPFLRDVQGRRGITEFLVVCDETNNTPEVIDRNEFVGDIYVKPTRSINNIKLNFIATRTGVDFREIVGA
jgi:hypothetical protein